MTKHIGERSLAERVTPRTDLRVPVWVHDAGRRVPGVLLAWDKRNGTWWGLVAWDPGRGPERLWLPQGRLQPIRPT
ncbi:MAG: hypothetical protein LCI03_01025 [Actinobacteria bacterium]|nr:hypothetical protein [Actinomycetota bacterium]